MGISIEYWAEIICDGHSERLDAREATSIVIKEGTKRCSIALYTVPNLESIALPASVEELEFQIDGCPKLKRITVDPANRVYESKDDRCVLLKKSATLILGLNYIPEGVKRIADGAFACAPWVITLPTSLEHIESNAFDTGNYLPCWVVINSHVEAESGAFGSGDNLSIELGENALVSPDFFERVFSFGLSSKQVFLSPANRNYCIKDGHLCTKDGEELKLRD